MLSSCDFLTQKSALYDRLKGGGLYNRPFLPRCLNGISQLAIKHRAVLPPNSETLVFENDGFRVQDFVLGGVQV